MRYFWPARGTCGQNTGDVGLIDGGLQRREGCRRARGTPYILGGKIAMREHTRYIHEGGFRGGREETVAERARLSLETAMFFSREGKARRYLCDVLHGISWARRKGLSRNNPE